VVDLEYRAGCRDSARKWRVDHANYWKQYRAAKPESVERNRIPTGGPLNDDSA
jgi:hypothetical protein